MLLNKHFSLIQTLPSQSGYRQAFCYHYLHCKVALLIVIRHAKKQALLMAWPTLKALRLLTGCMAIGLLLYGGESQAADNTKKQAPMPMDLIELLGELGDDEANLDAAMVSIKGKQAAQPITKELPQSKAITNENSNKGARE